MDGDIDSASKKQQVLEDPWVAMLKPVAPDQEWMDDQYPEKMFGHWPLFCEWVRSAL